MFGMEYETRVSIKIDYGGNPYRPVANDNQDRFRIDLDISENQTILEFVLAAFDDHAHGVDAAIADFDARYEAMRTAMEACVDAPAGTPFEEVCEPLGITVLPVAIGCPLNGTELKKGKLDGPVHYTVGIALPQIPQLIVDKLGNPAGDKPKQRAAQANVVAAQLTAAVPHGVDRLRMQGYIALLYLQITAKLDEARTRDRSTNIIKNFTEALCRVPMDYIFDDLPEDEKRWLVTNHDTIVGDLRTTYSGVAGTWGLGHKKDKQLVPDLAKALINAAFRTRKCRVQLEKEFGAMTVIGRPEPVGEPVQNGYALELRRLGAGRGDLTQAHDAAVAFIRYDRQIHGTPDLRV